MSSKQRKPSICYENPDTLVIEVSISINQCDLDCVR